jgi:hypothetical protein
MQVDPLQVKKMKISPPEQQIPFFNASPTTTIANPTTANLYMLYNYHSSFFNQRFDR